MTEDLELFSEEKKSSLTIKDHIGKFIAYWPLFIVSLAICISAAMVYSRYATPKFRSNTLIIVKGQPEAKGEGDLIETALSGQLKPGFNMQNEFQLIRSKGLLTRVVTKGEFNISYYLIGKIRKAELYLDAPFRLIPQSITDSNAVVNLTLKKLTDKGGMIEYGTGDKAKDFNFYWNQAFKTKGQTFILTPKVKGYDSNAKYSVIWKPYMAAAEEMKRKITAGPYEKNLGIISLDIITSNLQQGQDILNAVVREYNLLDMEDRNIITQNTIRFIDDRLSIVSNELSGVEGHLEKYQGSNKVINLQAQSSQSFGNSNSTSQSLTEINVQQGVVSMIRNYFNNPATIDKLVPSTLGLDDPTLSALIGKYNDLQLTKQREAPLVAVNSTVMQDLNNQISNVRGNILESLQNISKNLKLQQDNLQQQNSQYNQFLSSLPRKERMMQEIKREQSITEGLYLYLLQKREEAAISSTSSNVTNYKQIEPAIGLGQVEPNYTSVKLYSILLGLMIPVGLILLKEFLNEKVITRTDITKILQIPLLADINHLPDTNKTGPVAVMGRSLLGEQFRILRTNISFLLKTREKQVILVTSSAANEGKSFISLNLAAVLAIPGKKVALLEFDLRKPTIVRNLETNTSIGITNYLSGKITDLAKVYHVIKDLPSLHIYGAGTDKSNPGDLLINKNLSHLFESLKQQYDYIIIDSAPVGIVSDAFILGEFSDVVLYTIRQRVSLKKQLNYLNDVVNSQKLGNIGIVFNDVKTGSKYGYYGLGYGIDYGKYLETEKA